MLPLEARDSMFKTFSWESAALSSSISASTGGTSRVDAGGLVIGGGKPQLLQCVMKLVLSAICSMDGRQVLMERNVHGPNHFGVVSFYLEFLLFSCTFSFL